MVHDNTTKLGRISSPTDFRDHQFLASAVLPQRVAGITTRSWHVPVAWDQGSTSQCVAFSSMLYLNSGPVRNSQFNQDHAPDFYHQCQEIDGFPLPHDGTTIRAAMKILQRCGYITTYRWAFDVPTLSNWILTKGPVVVGTDWLLSMFSTKSYSGKRFINFDPTSRIVGGHAYLFYGVNTTVRCPDGTKGAFLMQNSWGPEWGNKGRAFLSFTATKALLAEAGEAACADEVKLGK